MTLEQATAQHVESEKLAVAATLQRDQARGDMVRLGVELSDLPGRACAFAKRRSDRAAARRDCASAGAEKFSTRGQSRSRKSPKSMERQIALRQTAQAKQEDLATRRAEMAGLAERLASAETIAARMAHELQELVTRVATSLVHQQDSLVRSRNSSRRRTTEHQRAGGIAARGEVASRSARRSKWRRSSTQRACAPRTWTIRCAMRGRSWAISARNAASMEIERARNESEREHLRQSCVEELNAQPEDLIAEFPSLLERRGTARIPMQQYRELKSRIESMGPINMMALEEYNECEQRFEFLGRERTDLLQSITDTQQAIAELDQVCKLKFEEAFNFINQHFATAFHTLFGGGTGEMRLSEPDSSGEPGIDVVAQPPGKRLQNVLLLSGGEKAMTALALLIAIFRYQPSPFCILDEVDAPLDEANVGRFTKLVSEMSAGTQFIVVTHNRKTMEMASVLYGVTMQEPGVSKLVSVRWDEPAAAKAATNAA